MLPPTALCRYFYQNEYKYPKPTRANGTPSTGRQFGRVSSHPVLTARIHGPMDKCRRLADTRHADP